MIERVEYVRRVGYNITNPPLTRWVYPGMNPRATKKVSSAATKEYV